MNILILLVTLGAAFFAVGFAVQKLAEYVRGDGAAAHGGSRTPPRSHHLDQFDPRWRAI